MFASIKKILIDNTWTINFPTSLFIKKDEAELDDFVQQIYCTANFEKWFNFFPFVWVTFDREYFDVGCTGTFRFLFPPFSYKMTCIEAIHNECYKAVFSGMMKGGARASFIQKESGILLDHPLKVSGKNKLIHIYYWLFLRPPHLRFMNWRYSILKKNLIRQALNKGDCNECSMNTPFK